MYTVTVCTQPHPFGTCCWRGGGYSHFPTHSPGWKKPYWRGKSLYSMRRHILENRAASPVRAMSTAGNSGGGGGEGVVFRSICHTCAAKFASINLRDCVLDHRNSACEDLPWHPSWPDYCCTSYHTTHSIHNQMILIPVQIKEDCGIILCMHFWTIWGTIT